MSRISAVKHQLLLTEWAERIHICQTSGLSVIDWCATNGINSKTYYYWLKKVREQALANLPQPADASVPVIQSNRLQDVANEQISFKKLEVVTPLPSMQAAVIIRLPNATLEVTNDASQRTVEAVLLALKSVC